MRFSSGRPVLLSTPVSNESGVLMEAERWRQIAELFEAAETVCDCRMKEYLAGRGTLEFLLDSSRRLLHAEVEKAHDKSDRVAAMERHFKRMYEIEKINKERFEEGKVATQDLASATYCRCEAELNLLREKKQ